MSDFSNLLAEYTPQMELEGAPVQEPATEYERAIFDEHQEMEAAIELLEAADERQLDRVLVDLIRKANGETGNTLSLPVGGAVAGVLKAVAGQVLPLAPETAGQPVGSRLGAQLGRGLASVAGPALGLELEGLSREDSEFEAIRQFVRFAAKTVENAGGIAPNAAPADIAHHAVAMAARVYAPGLMTGVRRPRRQADRWGPARRDSLVG
jgi:hypothetical protein